MRTTSANTPVSPADNSLLTGTQKAKSGIGMLGSMGVRLLNQASVVTDPIKRFFNAAMGLFRTESGDTKVPQLLSSAELEKLQHQLRSFHQQCLQQQQHTTLTADERHGSRQLQLQQILLMADALEHQQKAQEMRAAQWQQQHQGVVDHNDDTRKLIESYKRQ